MKNPFRPALVSMVLLPFFGLPLLGQAVGGISRADERTVDFTKDVKPILSRNCFVCHGPDEGSREADLRLDRADAALAELPSGSFAIVSGQPDASALIERITTDDPELRMPPAATGHVLSADQVETLRRWIAAGAKYDEHWSFRPIVDHALPNVRNQDWVRNPIDRFVLQKLESLGLQPAPEANRSTLLRRLSLDILGLPPSPEEVAEFLSDASSDAYERQVDRLLASPHFGERWGRHWLDLAHYADSDGYLGDALRPNAWLYRNWVITAINQDMPFDQFTVEQLAGDLLPDAAINQRIATGFLRNTLRNTEAGVDLEEYRLKEIVDRVSTVGIGWLGLSLGCAECHSHKYDPISHREFYELFSFFNNADDVDVPAPQPGEVERYELALKDWSTKESKLSEVIQKRLATDERLAAHFSTAPLLEVLRADAKKRTAEQKKTLADFTREADEELRELTTRYEELAKKKPQPPSTKAMTIARRKAERVSYVHLRGDYRSRGENVRAGTPAVLPPLRAREQDADRLDLAHWLVHDENPLTPRVTVNRIWKQLFGQGLVTTVDNFGAGGEAPSHPELLDWLAARFRDGGWNRKALIRLIVTSATYRQSSDGRPELESRDPQNALLARQQRFRLEAEVVRDVALASADLLERRIGGPSIRPPQPAYVTSISRNTEWKVSAAPDLYRRGLYILLRRATPYPMLLTFDAPDSTVACVRRERSNSPLQALTLLNDPVFVDCARRLGLELADDVSRSVEERLSFAFQRCLGREATTAELERLHRLFDERRKRLRENAAAARAITGKADSRATNGSASTGDEVERAAWILVARVVMNLDEFITRE